MKHTTLSWCMALLSMTFLFLSCDEDTGTLGLLPEEDATSSSSATYGVLSGDLINDVVLAGSTTSYLGKVIDPETDEAIAATFAAQFHTFENYTFPSRQSIVPSDDGLLCDSVELRLFIKSTFGDKNNPMKMEVWPLSMDADKVIKESASLYTNTDLWQYVDDSDGPVATKVFTATDYAMTDAQRASTGYTANVRIVLPRQMGHDIMQKYYSNPALFRDSYSFIRGVCPGFLFRTTSGTGTMLSLEVSTMNINFRYTDPVSYPDSTLSGLCRFAATPEVIQSTQFESSNLAGLIGHDDYTMLKTPAGICTELILPVDEVFLGHENDSISRASLTLTRINNQDEAAQNDSYALGIPANLLLVRKQNLASFFENHEVADQQQSYTTAFQSVYNSYSFSNIGRLLAYLYREKSASMKAGLEDYKAECMAAFSADQSAAIAELKAKLGDDYNAKAAQYVSLSELAWQMLYEPRWTEVWNERHPDWNHVVLVPVTVSTNTDSYGLTSQVAVNHDLSLGSTKLVRGTAERPIQMQVFFSHYAGI